MRIKKIWAMSTFRLLFLVVLVVIPLNILTLMLSSTAVKEVEQQVSAETRSALELYMSQVDGAMERITKKMHSMAMNDVDLSRINQKDILDQEEYYKQLQSVVNLYNTFGKVLNDNSWITGVYAVQPEKDFYVVRSSNNYVNYKSAMAEYLAEFEEQEQTLWVEKWRIVKLQEQDVLMFAAKNKNVYYGAWIELTHLAETLGFLEQGDEVATLFTDETGMVCYSNGPKITEVALDEPFRRYDGKSYVLVEAQSENSNIFLVQILPKSEITKSLPVVIQVLQIGAFAALLILPVILFGMQKWIIRPVSRLTQAMEMIEAGNMDFRIQEEKTGSEFVRINQNFNRMMDEVSTLKIDVYEEKLEKQQIKMKFLSQQIQPHFILNAMNILYSYEQEEYPLIQKMILCLAKYFRYIVNANSDFVRLKDEMEHIRNYFEIQQVRYPKTFFAMVEYEEEIADCLVPPLLIQNFAENAIKHSLKIGNKIDIFVIAQKYKEDTVRIRMMDTGEGINEELIEKVKQFRKTGEYQEGLGVGIQNAVERLNVLYGVETKFEITRDEPHGTRIELVLPLHYEEKEDENESIVGG